MKIGVLGASGFLGSWLCRILILEHDITAFIRDNSSTYNLSNIKSLNIIRTDLNKLIDEIKMNKFDVLIFADWDGVGNIERNNPKQFENSVRILKLAKSLNNSRVKMVLALGSQAELGPVSLPIMETQMDSPTTLYGEAKLQVRSQLASLLNDKGIRFCWMRIFSTYGPLDIGNWLIPNIVESIKSNQTVQLTKGEQEWSYLHAYDLANAFKTVVESGSISGIINVGNPNTVKIKQVAEITANIFGKKNLLDFGSLPYRSDQVMRLEPVCESLAKLGWRPKVSISHGVSNTVNWLKKGKEIPLMLDDGSEIFFNLPIRK